MNTPATAPPRTPGRTRKRLLRACARRHPNAIPPGVTRRFQALPAQAYCTACAWPGATGDPMDAEQAAMGHRLDKGHETRVTTVQEVTYGVPEPAEVGAGA